MSVPLYKPSIKRKDMDSVLTCLVSDQIGPSSLSEELIEQISQLLQCSGGIALRDYGRAVELALDSLELEQGSRVLLSPLAPAIYFRVLEDRGLSPLFCQVDQSSGLMERQSVEELKAQNPAAVIVFHGLGLATPMDMFQDWDIPIVEDITQSFGASWGEQQLGTFGDLVILGMEYHHIITAGGGTLLFSRKEYLENLQQISASFPHESFLPDMNASLALVQLSQMESFLEKRRSLGELFRQSVQRGKHRLLRQPEGGTAVWYSLPLFLNSSTRDVSLYARKKNVETTLAFAGSVLEYTGDDALCAQARLLSMRTLLFPLYPMMGSRNADLVNKVLATLP